MQHKKIILIIFIITFSVSIPSGCLNESKPYANIQYKVSIWTNEPATLYLPLPLDLPNYTVADLVLMIKASTESADTKMSYDVIDTIYGKALRVNTTGDVVLHAKTDYEYLKTHPKVPVHSFTPGQNEPMFFDLSLQVDQADKLNYSRWAYLGPNSSSINIKVFEWLVVSYDPGAEGWSSLEDNSPYDGNFTLKPGWQIIKFDHTIGYH